MGCHGMPLSVVAASAARMAVVCAVESGAMGETHSCSGRHCSNVEHREKIGLQRLFYEVAIFGEL